MHDAEGAVVVVVRDLECAIRWYRCVFDVHVEFERPGINGLPIEASLWRRGGPNLVLLLARVAPPELPRQTVLRLAVVDDLDALAERAAAVDESSAAVPSVEHTAFGRQLVLHDPDGHTLVLLDAGPSTRAQ
jgi:hypothetical protein